MKPISIRWVPFIRLLLSTQFLGAGSRLTRLESQAAHSENNLARTPTFLAKPYRIPSRGVNLNPAQIETRAARRFLERKSSVLELKFV